LEGQISVASWTNFPSDARIILKKQNARRPGTAAADHYNKYRHGMTICEYKEVGGELKRLCTDIGRGNVAIIADVHQGLPAEPVIQLEQPPSRLPSSSPYLTRTFSFSILNMDTAEGRFAADIYLALTEQLGGDLTAAQQLLVQSTALTALRCELLSRAVFAAPGCSTTCNENHLLAWLNSLRRDLVALGIAAQPVIDPAATLSAFISTAQRRIGGAT
jgi:hypothetical protein